jgi:molecular chaperone GrpE
MTDKPRRPAGDARPKSSGAARPAEDAGTPPEAAAPAEPAAVADPAPASAPETEAADAADAAEQPDPAPADTAEADAPPAAESDGESEAAEADGDADLQAAADALEVDLELLLAEREQYLDAYRRAQADFENYRKQAQKRLDDAVLRSLGGFVERLLPVLDSCDAALAHGASEVEPVVTALHGALAKEGLERIDPKGSAFDPAEAEAVVHEPGEGGEQVVAEVLRPGYRWRGRVIRPAMVKVTD